MEEEQVSFEDYFRIIYERKWIIIIAFFVVVISTALFTFRQEPVYEATCTIMIEPKAPEAIFELGGPSRINIENYTAILKSHTIARHTIAKVKERDFSILQAENPVLSFLGRLNITPVRGGDILRISVKGKTPLEASVLANTIADVLIELELATARMEFTEQRDFLEEQIPIVRANLEEMESRLKKFKEKTRIVALSEETKQLTEKLLEFDALYGEVKSELESKKAKLVSLEVNLKEMQETLSERISEISSSYILALREELVNLETTHSMLLVQGLPEDNLKLVRLRKSIEETKAKLVEETYKIKNEELPTLDPLSSSQQLVDEIISLRIEVEGGQARLNTIGGVIKRYERRIQRLPGQELEFAEIKREREITANTYKVLRERYEEVRIAEAGKISNVRVIDLARPPENPVSPRKRLNLMLAVVIGLLVGVGGAFVVDYTDHSIKTPGDVEKYIGLSTLGSVPVVKRKNNNPSLLLTSFSLSSVFQETYRGIRTNLQFINPDSPIHTLLITSPSANEGKTTVALNLAITLSQLGLNTLILDADMRRPTVYKCLGIHGESLAKYLVSGGNIQSYILPTEIENLSAIIVKKTPPNPAELLGSNKMKNLLSELRKKFDFIIIDTPPLLSCTDAAVLASSIDGVLIVARSHKTHRDALRQARDVMERVRAKIAGVVLNAVPVGRGAYGYYRYHHYYHYHYEEEKSEV